MRAYIKDSVLLLNGFKGPGSAKSPIHKSIDLKSGNVDQKETNKWETSDDLPYDFLPAMQDLILEWLLPLVVCLMLSIENEGKFSPEESHKHIKAGYFFHLIDGQGIY